MLKRFSKRIGLNFKQTKSERVANTAYRNYHQKLRKMFQKVDIFKKLNRDK